MTEQSKETHRLASSIRGWIKDSLDLDPDADRIEAYVVRACAQEREDIARCLDPLRDRGLPEDVRRLGETIRNMPLDGPLGWRFDIGCGPRAIADKPQSDPMEQERARCEQIALRIAAEHRARDAAAQAARDIEASARELSKAQAADEIAQAIREGAKP